MRCLIVDDEPLARQEMKSLLSAHPEVEEIHTAAGVKEAVQWCRAARPEAVFLDIQLRGENGFDFLSLAPHPLPSIVFVTAFDRYAIQAFDHHALDYLLKPVHPERLKETISRLAAPASVRSSRELLLPMNGVVRKVHWDDLHAIESEGNYTRVCLANGSATLMLRPLKEWLDMAPRGFLQVHRTVMIRLAAIQEIRALPGGRREITLASGKIFPVSRSCWPRLKQVFS